MDSHPRHKKTPPLRMMKLGKVARQIAWVVASCNFLCNFSFSSFCCCNSSWHSTPIFVGVEKTVLSTATRIPSLERGFTALKEVTRGWCISKRLGISPTHDHQVMQNFATGTFLDHRHHHHQTTDCKTNDWRKQTATIRVYSLNTLGVRAIPSLFFFKKTTEQTMLNADWVEQDLLKTVNKKPTRRRNRMKSPAKCLKARLAKFEGMVQKDFSFRPA